ncbi:hypothetical protein Acr_12g0003330 [Actinidia rufa]|uniref:Retrotransposon gag domain-containing protein n=1 Tax=Actinidia rufa TaxID=165716 RepID=A0A7J0FGG1_9ERIC|nr:hypothetical protein Acr_12g0003330 [Actinidia rufa]
MVNTRSSEQGNRVNANTQMDDELRDMMQTLVGAMATQQQLLQQHLQPPQPQQPRDQYSDGEENQTRGETSEYRGETEDPAIPQKVEIGSYLLTGAAASRWWNLKGNAKCAEFEHLKQTGRPIAEYEAAFTNLEEYAPHLVATDEMRARRFEDGLRYEIKKVIRPLLLLTYADVLDCGIIVEQDEMEKRKYFDSKKR